MNLQQTAALLFDLLVQQRTALEKLSLELSQGESGALLYLSTHTNGIPQNELSSHLGISTPRVTAIVNTRQQKGLLTKAPDQTDRRKTRLHITPKGTTTIEHKKQQAMDIIFHVLRNLTPNEIENYIHLLKKIQHIMEESS